MCRGLESWDTARHRPELICQVSICRQPDGAGNVRYNSPTAVHPLHHWLEPLGDVRRLVEESVPRTRDARQARCWLARKRPDGLDRVPPEAQRHQVKTPPKGSGGAW